MVLPQSLLPHSKKTLLDCGMPLGPLEQEGNDILNKQDLLGSEGMGKLVFCDHYVFGNKKRLVVLLPHTVLKIPLTIFILICGVLLQFLLLGKNVICYPLWMTSLEKSGFIS